jgi:hypothetical protein
MQQHDIPDAPPTFSGEVERFNTLVGDLSAQLAAGTACSGNIVKSTSATSICGAMTYEKTCSFGMETKKALKE